MSARPTQTVYHVIIAVLTVAWAVLGGAPASAASLPENMSRYGAEAKAQDRGFSGFSFERGRVLFSSRHATGKPDTPSCTTCHGSNPTGVGQTRAGKEIAPMALSMSPDRYTDIEKLEKWFRRNCKGVLGRVCTPLDKGDFLTFMSSQ